MTDTDEAAEKIKTVGDLSRLWRNYWLRSGADHWKCLTLQPICRKFNDRMSRAASQFRIQNLSDLHSFSQPDLIEALTHGLPAELVREFAHNLELPLQDVAALLRLNPRTLQRRFDEGVLDLAESERLWDLSRLFQRAVEVFESRPAAVSWFKSPVQALGWVTPLAYVHTSAGIRAVDNILGRIEHGVFS